jgi:hypothetical protein
LSQDRQHRLSVRWTLVHKKQNWCLTA